MRETTKQVVHEVDEGQEMAFMIHKMNALQGSYLVKFCTEKLLPIFAEVRSAFTAPEDGQTEQEVTEERTARVFELIPKALASLSEEEVMNLETRCLQAVDAIYPGGLVPVMKGNNFNVEEVEYDIMLALTLCYEVIEFNLGSFFGGKNLGSVLQNLSSSRSNA